LNHPARPCSDIVLFRGSFDQHRAAGGRSPHRQMNDTAVAAGYIIVFQDVRGKYARRATAS
jgi:predicted acyl esterase